MAKKIIGILLILAGAGLLTAVIISVGACLPQSGALKGSIMGYRAPYYGHGLLMIVLGIASVLSFLGGAVMIAVDSL